MSTAKIDDPEQFQFATVVLKDSKSTHTHTQLESPPIADCSSSRADTSTTTPTSPNFSMVPLSPVRRSQKSVIPSLAAQKFDQSGQHKKTKIIRAHLQLLLDRLRLDVHDGERGHPQDTDIKQQLYA